VIKVLKGNGTNSDIAAIEQALRDREVSKEQNLEYGKPILRSPLHISERPSE